MPNKSRKIASKQAQIGHRKRKPKSTSSVSANDGSAISPNYEVAVGSSSVPDLLDPIRHTAVSSADILSSRPNVPKAVNRHIWSEIRYIGGLSLIIFIIMGTLTTVID